MKTWKTIQREIEELRAKYRRQRYHPAFPDLDCGVSPCSDMSNARGGNTNWKVPMPQHHGLLVGTPHKQGPMVMSKDDIQWAGGKKS